MTRNVNLPNFTTTEDPEYTYRAGRVKDSHILIRRTEGYLEYIAGATQGMVANIVIYNGTPPEIPSPKLLSLFNWEYYETQTHHGDTHSTTRYRFIIDDADAEKLRDAVFYFDTLYG